MRLDKLCSLEFRYLDFHFPKPYGDESGPGWGIGEGTVSGERLSGAIKWSNHPSLRCDGVALPDFRGVISTADGAKVLVCFTGRTVFVPRETRRWAVSCRSSSRTTSSTPGSIARS